jgi:hypothetical protein
VHEDDVPLTRHPWRYDHERNRATLDALAATGAQTVLTGHGEPWRHGAEAAVEAAGAAPIA